MAKEQKKKKMGIGKKIAIGFVVLCLLGAVFGSGEDNKQSASAPEGDTVISLLEATPETLDVKSGSGNNVIGKRDYYALSKEALKATSADDFNEFLNEKIDKEKMWTTIDFGDGTGLVIISLIEPDVTYAELGEQDHISKELGYLKWEDDSSFTYVDGARV